jgi:hypothetical protein
MTDMAQDPAFWNTKNMKRVMVDCNTCNTENFGIDTPPPIYRQSKSVYLDCEWIPQRGRIYKKNLLD